MSNVTVLGRIAALREDITSEIDGGEECHGRDSMLSDWDRRLEVMERIIKRGINAIKDAHPHIENAEIREKLGAYIVILGGGNE